jgi:hypothetical protein
MKKITLTISVLMTLAAKTQVLTKVGDYEYLFFKKKEKNDLFKVNFTKQHIVDNSFEKYEIAVDTIKNIYSLLYYEKRDTALNLVQKINNRRQPVFQNIDDLLIYDKIKEAIR